MPDHKTVIDKIKVCMHGGNYMYKRIYHLYDRLMMRISDKIGSNDYKVEQRHLEWTTYTNINIWFETLKHFLLARFLIVQRLKVIIVMGG